MKRLAYRPAVVCISTVVAVDDWVVQANGAAAKMRVLVVDDASAFREVARELLERRGYVVVSEADCAAAAREAVERLAPDAILLDVNLPDANGFELATELMRSELAPAILLVSADDGLRELAPEDLALPFVAKAQLAGVDLADFWPDSCEQATPARVALLD